MDYNYYWNNYLLEYISWNNKKSQFLEKGFHVKRNREAAEREKGQEAEQEKRKGLKLTEFAGFTQVRGGLSSLNGYYGIVCDG